MNERVKIGLKEGQVNIRICIFPGVHRKNTKEGKMQFKQKLIYFALGCAFMVISQVLSGVVVSKVTAQGKKESVEFDTVTCRSLKVVDDSGKVRAQLEVKKNPKLDFLNDIIQVFNRNGNLVFNLATGTEIPGMVTMFDKMGEKRVERC